MSPVDVESLHGRRADNRWDRISIGDVFERWALHSPDAEALVGRPGAWSHPDYERVGYARADLVATQFAHALLEHGLVRGDRVFFLCGNSVEAFLAKIGVAKAGGVVAAINPDQATDVIDHAFRLASPAFVVVDAEYVAAIEELPGEVPVVVVPIGGSGAIPPGAMTFRDFHHDRPVDDLDVRIHGDDIWEILFTSGTTALPKAVMLSHTFGYLCALSWAVSYSRGLLHESFLRIACFTPTTFHVGDQGYMMPALFAGGTVIIGRRFDAVGLAGAVAEEKATAVIGGGGPLLRQLADELGQADPGSLEHLTCVVYGPGPLAVETRDRLKEAKPGVLLLAIAAQTECAAGHRLIDEAFAGAYDIALHRGENLVGKPFPLLGARIDREGAVVGAEQAGELLYRSPVMMSGYYRDPAATDAAFRDGWFHTGDLAYQDGDGFRILVGRMKDMIKTGGENVSCARVEAVIERHPSVDRVVVVGMPDERWGEAVTAIVVAKRDAGPVSEFAIIRFCRDRLAGFETPKRVIFTDDLEVDFQGKVSRRVIRETYAARH